MFGTCNNQVPWLYFSVIYLYEDTTLFTSLALAATIYIQ